MLSMCFPLHLEAGVEVWVRVGPRSLVCVPQPREDQWTLDEFRNLHSAIVAA